MKKLKIHTPSDDEIAIVKFKLKVKSQLSKVLSNEQAEMRTVKSLADNMLKMAKEKQKLIDIQENLEDLLDIAVRNPVSTINSDEVKVLKRSNKTLMDSLNNQRMLAESFLDLHSIMKEFLRKKNDYIKDYQDLLTTHSKWHDLSYLYMKEKNKFVDDTKLRKKESKLSDLESKINRLQTQINRKIEWLIEDAQSVDRGWSNVKDSIKKNTGW